MPQFALWKHIFDHPWKEISLASWRKYPCESRPDVLAWDIVDYHIDENTGVLTTKRVLYNKSQCPRWLASIFGGEHFYFQEHATIDPRKQSMVLTGTNISFHDILEMVEVCSYTTSKEKANATLFDQQMTVTAFPSFASGRIEKFLVEKASDNAVKGRVVMEQAIARLQAEAREKLAEMEMEARERFAEMELEAREKLAEMEVEAREKLGEIEELIG